MNRSQIIVVGSGPASATAAMVLVEHGLNVLMLESGSAPTGGFVVRAAGNVLARRLPQKHLTAQGRHVSKRGIRTDWWQSLTPGGCSNHWTSAVPRYAPGDFADGARLGPELVWPICYDDLVPFYDFVEDLLRVTAGDRAFDQLPLGRAAYRRTLPADWEPVAAAALASGAGMTPMPMAIGHRWMIARRGTEFSSYHSVVRRLLGRPNFELRLGAHVVEVLPTDAAQGGPGVRYRSKPGNHLETVRGPAVVLGAGALATTRLLLASRSVDAPNGLGNGGDLVGRYLHDHPRSWFPFRTSKPLSLPSHVHYVVREPYDSADAMAGTSLTIGLARAADRLKTYVGASGTDFGVQVFGSMQPTSSRGVELSDELDDNEDPKLVLDFGPDGRGHASVRGANERVRSMFAAAGIEIEVANDPGLGPPGSSVHIGGTVRMHADPAFGVLDAWNRLHEMPEILVCDMSAFTTGPEKNPTLTAMAMSARAAERLAAELGAQADPRTAAT